MKYLAFITGAVILTLASFVASDYIFNRPDVIFDTVMLVSGLYFLYDIANTRVQWERDKEQRLLDKIRDSK